MRLHDRGATIDNGHCRVGNVMQEGRHEPMWQVSCVCVVVMCMSHVHEPCVVRLAAVRGLFWRLTIAARF